MKTLRGNPVWKRRQQNQNAAAAEVAFILTTPFRRYNSSNLFPLFELGQGVSARVLLVLRGVDEVAVLVVDIS